MVDRTIIKADEDYDGRISFNEFKKMVKDLDVANKLTLSSIWRKKKKIIFEEIKIYIYI